MPARAQCALRIPATRRRVALLLAEIRRAGGIHCVVAVHTDGASNCRAALKALAAEPEFNGQLDAPGCGEHMCERLLADVLKVITWVKSLCHDVHKAHRTLRRRKRVMNYIRAAQDKAKRERGVPIRRLRLVRRTRHCSHLLVVQCFLVNREIICTALNSGALTEALGKEDAKLTHTRRVFTKEPHFARAKRAYGILAPICRACRALGCADYSAVVPVLAKLRLQLPAAIRRNDFAERGKAERPEDLDGRYQQVLEKLEARLGGYLADCHCVAFLLDTRVHALLDKCGADVSAAELSAGYPVQDHFQACKPRAMVWLHRHCGGNAHSALTHFLDRTGIWASTHLPTDHCTWEDVAAWWRHSSPCAVLARAALNVLARRPSQGSCERAWATLSRQLAPIRAALSAATKARLVNIAMNHSLLTGAVHTRTHRQLTKASLELHARLEALDVGEVGAVGDDLSSDSGVDSSTSDSSMPSAHSEVAPAEPDVDDASMQSDDSALADALGFRH